MKKLWGGAFREEASELADQFGQSIDSDLTFWQEDVEASIAHATMLGECKILTNEDAEALVNGLQQILEEGPEKLPRNVEDIHTAVEVRLGEIVGDVAGKLHTARSRNDQVATDTRLFLRRRMTDLESALRSIQAQLIETSEELAEAVVPGSTHGQHAQPVTMGFHLLAYFWAMQRHRFRVQGCIRLVNCNPLGCAALSGTGFAINRDRTTALLGFDQPYANALDATSERSYVLDALHVCTQIMLDLSRLSQEIVLWTAPEFGYVKLSDALTTGSSIMPQKRNPDMAELIRGRAARALANYTQVATMMKGLVMGYNRDTQEDKPPLFDSLDLSQRSLQIATAMLASAEWDTDRMEQACTGDFSTATDLADDLAAAGMAFRQAHEVVGKVVRYCMDKGIGLEQLTLEQLQELAPSVPDNFAFDLSPHASVKRRSSYGGTAPEAVRSQLSLAKERLNQEEVTPY
ncbi:MAG: argininosuccinate lyase [Fimbriimonadaceae bacterium]